MKFCKKYEEYMQGEFQKKKKKLPRVGFKQLKKILKRCRRDLHSRNVIVGHSAGDPNLPVNRSSCPHHCPVCDGTFFPSLLKEMSAVVDWFNLNAQRLLDLHLASGFRKCLILFKDKNHVSLVQEGKELVTYAIINSIAMRKILKKYDKIHYSNQGQAFKSQANSMHIEILQSPWLCELMAFHINLKHDNKRKAPAFFEGCSLVFKDGKPSLLCDLFDPVKLEIDLTCSICLDTVFDPASLTCGHIFCYMCACKAGSVTIVDGLKAADSKEKCPLCREVNFASSSIRATRITFSLLEHSSRTFICSSINQYIGGVYEGAVHLEELNILLSRSCPEYWEERLHTERVERVRQAKEHWESQCRAFMGI